MATVPSLRQLRAFRHVMSLGGVSAAAEVLNLTQPALSKQIASLEETLGMQLFARRRGGPFVPTKEGLAFYRSIEGTLFGLDAIPDIAQNIARHAQTQLRIAGTPPILNCEAFAIALSSLRTALEGVQISLHPRPRLELEDWVRSRQANLSLGLLPSRHPDLATVTLINSQCVAAMSPSHPLADRTVLTVNDLKLSTLVLPSRQPLRDRIDAAVPGLTCEIETSSSISCVGLALSQNAVALSDPLSPSMYPPGSVHLVPFEPAIPLSYGALLYRGTEADPLILAILDALRKGFRSC